MAFLYLQQSFRHALIKYFPAFSTTFRSNVDQIITRFNDFHIVLDNDDGIAFFDEFVEGDEQLSDVLKVKTCRRFIEYEKCMCYFIFLGKKTCQFNPLCFTP